MSIPKRSISFTAHDWFLQSISIAFLEPISRVSLFDFVFILSKKEVHDRFQKWRKKRRKRIELKGSFVVFLDFLRIEDGPQYVCTTFLTFVCTNCSGVHREFTHRVKSVSMAKFSAEEVSALQAGGNERARQLYFKEWDPQRNSYPDGSNLHRLRDFIKHVYVDRRYSGERSHDRVSRPRLGEREESCDSRKVGPYRDGSRSPNYEDRYQKTERSRPGGRSEERIVKYYYDERRSPRYAQDISRSGGLKKSPVRFEIVDDRVRSGRETRLGSLPPNRQKTLDQSTYPVVRSIKDILGENVPSLQIGENSKTNNRNDAVTSAQNQIIASYSSKESAGVQAVEEKIPHSLIDFNTDSIPSDAVVASQIPEDHQSGGNCNSNQSSAKQDAPPAPKPNTLEFLLLELSVPSVEPSGSVSDMSNNGNPPLITCGGNMLTTSGASAAMRLGQLLTLPDNAGVSTDIPGGNVPTGGTSSEVPLAQWLTLPDNAEVSKNIPAGIVPSGSSMGQMLSLPSSLDASVIVSGGNIATGNVRLATPMGQISTPSRSADVTGDSMSIDGMPVASSAEQTLLLLDTATSLASSKPVQPSNEGAPQTVIDIDGDSTCKIPNAQPVSFMQQHQLSAFPAVVDRSSGLQTSTTKVGAPNNQLWTSLNMPNPQGPSASAELPSQVVTIFQDSNSVINSQHLPGETKSSERKELPVPVPQYSNQAKSSNPFDIHNEATSIQVSPFPSMGNMQAAFPNMSASRALLPTSSIDTNPSGLMATQGPYSYASAIPLQTSPFASVSPSDTYMGQQLQMNMPPFRAQGHSVGFGSNGVFGSVNMSEQSPRGYQLPSPPHSAGGNPFG
ncbi:flocculation protein FLO11-like isoform X2 [Euphorbia lathyris]|uniref:flocculation protein FLO11-like isoform X2 n=1 Tax=Euphorbia lathyris TaxID=212925 RepID=UPI0033132C6B